MSKIRQAIVCILVWLVCSIAENAADGLPILNYHRFGPKLADSMTVKTSVFEAQLNWLQENGYTVIPLKTLVDY